MENPQPITKPTLFSHDDAENLDLSHPYFNSHLITYIGNKRKLLSFLYDAFLDIRRRLGKEKLTVFDGFAGSGAVARLLKAFSEELYVNDFEGYSETLNRAYLTNRSQINYETLQQYIDWLNENKHPSDDTAPGFIERHYAPEDDNNIQPGERVFYTNRNARIIDNVRRLINDIPEPYKSLCLASLLIEASVHTNTSGVFKGFHKKDGVGHFGGGGEDALSRITQDIELETPMLSNYECPIYVYRRDTNKLVKDPELPIFDLVYYDPPYNQHPYGSNYFMLNIINSGKEWEIQDGVSGIPKEWQRSAYNKRREAEKALNDLIYHTSTRFIVLSYNNEGLIPADKIKQILSRHGHWELKQQDYNTYRGSRNLHKRSKKVKELLWILEKEA